MNFRDLDAFSILRDVNTLQGPTAASPVEELVKAHIDKMTHQWVPYVTLADGSVRQAKFMHAVQSTLQCGAGAGAGAGAGPIQCASLLVPAMDRALPCIDRSARSLSSQSSTLSVFLCKCFLISTAFCLLCKCFLCTC